MDKLKHSQLRASPVRQLRGAPLQSLSAKQIKALINLNKTSTETKKLLLNELVFRAQI
jgi:hypothetical protein